MKQETKHDWTGELTFSPGSIIIGKGEIGIRKSPQTELSFERLLLSNILMTLLGGR